MSLSSPSSRPPLGWVIVGGGIHGVHLAIRLLDAGLASTGRLAILDPETRPLAAWTRRAERIGMRFLRSPIVHHLAPRPAELSQFLDRTRPPIRHPATRGPNRRPSLELFHAHCRHLIEAFELGATWRVGRAVGLRRSEDRSSWTVTTERGSLTAANVALALGTDGALGRPAWADADEGRITHLLDPETVIADPEPGERVAVVGGGLTAAQAAVRWAEGGAEVVVVSRHAIRVARYDTAPGWLGPKYMRDFARLRCPGRRRELVDAARNRGTMTSDVARRLRRLRSDGRVRWVRGEVCGLEGLRSGLSLALTSEDGPGPGERVEVRRVLLATGAAPTRPGGAWLQEVIRREALPLGPCGYPLPDPFLRWAPGLHVTGPLAELVVGPVARNIAGARRCADRILAGAPDEEWWLREEGPALARSVD